MSQRGTAELSNWFHLPLAHFASTHPAMFAMYAFVCIVAECDDNPVCYITQIFLYGAISCFKTSKIWVAFIEHYLFEFSLGDPR